MSTVPGERVATTGVPHADNHSRLLTELVEEAAEVLAKEQKTAGGEGSPLSKGLMFAVTLAVGLGVIWLGLGRGNRPPSSRLVERAIRNDGVIGR